MPAPSTQLFASHARALLFDPPADRSKRPTPPARRIGAAHSLPIPIPAGWREPSGPVRVNCGRAIPEWVYPCKLGKPMATMKDLNRKMMARASDVELTSLRLLANDG